MGVSIPEELSVLGVSSKDFEKKRLFLAKFVNSEVNENDVIWELYKDLLKKAHNFEILQMIYWNMALFKDKIGKNSFDYQQKSQQSRLLNLRRQGKTKVKINAEGCSPSCRKLHNLVLPISKALENLPIPNPKCETKLNSNNTICKSIYLVAKDNEVESLKLPSPVKDLPELPELEDVFKETKKILTWLNIIDWGIPLATFFSGFVMFFYSPITSLILCFWSIVFLPPIIKLLLQVFPFVKKKLCRYIIFVIGFSVIIFFIFISLFSDKKINSIYQKSVIPPYQILSIQDHSIGTRSRLYVSIMSPDAQSRKERALVVMEAAKKIHANEFFNKSNYLKYDYIFVSLEEKKSNSDKSYVFAEAEFAPDGHGYNGSLNDNYQKWKWNVRSSNFKIEENNQASLQMVKGTLKTFLLR